MQVKYHYTTEKRAFTIKLPVDLYNKVNRFAKSEKMSMSAVIEGITAELFEHKQ